DKSIGHWRFSCVMWFPWRPILSGDSSLVEVSQNQGLISAATRYTEYYFCAESGKVC
ncbi:hypothetical protein ACJX0J_042036, partial [Zea mays]